MRVRRCAVLFLEPGERPEFDLDGLLRGEAGVRMARGWLAHAPHLPAPVELDLAMYEALGGLPVQEWSVLEGPPAPALERLLAAGLVMAEGRDDAVARAEAAVRGAHWWPVAALAHYASRWQGRDAAAATEAAGMDTVAGMRARLGTPPPAVAAQAAVGPPIALERGAEDALDALLRGRTTCRNFDARRPLPLALLARMLERGFGAQAQWRDADGSALFLKKGVPSGGGLHPTEAYLLVRRVQGLAPGLYHYHPLDHALARLPDPPLALDELAMRTVAGQHWFADAPVMVVMAARFLRCFWKYRGHPKAYRAIAMDAGHLSQTLYLSATDLGLGAFVTCAVNEADIEQAFGLDPYEQGVMAVTGFGYRGAELRIAEFDPAGRTWGRPIPAQGWDR